MQEPKNTLNFKYSIIILNFHRPHNTIAILKKLVDYKFIDNIIISNTINTNIRIIIITIIIIIIVTNNNKNHHHHNNNV